MEKILGVLGGMAVAIVLVFVKIAFWVYLFYVAHHFATKFW